jgi:hypothetical protein
MPICYAFESGTEILIDGRNGEVTQVRESSLEITFEDGKINDLDCNITEENYDL